jgi:hypothetical protein
VIYYVDIINPEYPDLDTTIKAYSEKELEQFKKDFEVKQVRTKADLV